MTQAYPHAVWFLISTFMHRLQTQTFVESTTTFHDGIGRHFLSTYNDKLWVITGEGTSSGHRSGIESTQLPLNGNEWTNTPGALPLGISNLLTAGDCSVSVGHNVYFINPDVSGGTATNYHELFVYDLSSHSYSVEETPPSLSRGVCAAYNPNNNIIYAVAGGLSGSDWFKYTQRYDVTTKTWLSNGRDTITERSFAGCSMNVAADTLFLFGGSNPTYLDSIERYDIASDKWFGVTDTLSVARTHMKCRTLMTDGNIYCMGGYGSGGSSNTRDVVDIFDPGTESITGTINMNVERWNYGAVVWNNGKCILVVGGKGSNGDYRNTIESIGECSTTPNPTPQPTKLPSLVPTLVPSRTPTSFPTIIPTLAPTLIPTLPPTSVPSRMSTNSPTMFPTLTPTSLPTHFPTTIPTSPPSINSTTPNIETTQVNPDTAPNSTEVTTIVLKDGRVKEVNNTESFETVYVPSPHRQSDTALVTLILIIAATALVTLIVVSCFVYKMKNADADHIKRNIDREIVALPYPGVHKGSIALSGHEFSLDSMYNNPQNMETMKGSETIKGKARSNTYTLESMYVNPPNMETETTKGNETTKSEMEGENEDRDQDEFTEEGKPQPLEPGKGTQQTRAKVTRTSGNKTSGITKTREKVTK
eukprot:225158_1